MKRLLAYLFIVLGLGFFVNFNSFAKEINEEFYKFKKILIPLSKDGSWELIGRKSQNIYGAQFTWKYFSQTKNKKLSKLIEVVHATVSPESMSQTLSWFKNFTFQTNGYNSCIPNDGNTQSSMLREKYYVFELSKKSGTNCFFTRNMNIEKEVLNPDIRRQTQYIDTNHFPKVIKKYLDNEIKFPKIMLRSDHYFFSQNGLYAYFEMVNPETNGAPNTLFKSEKQNEYYPLNIDNHPEKKDFYLNWIKDQAKKHSKFENELKKKTKLNLAKYINYEASKDYKNSSEVILTVKKKQNIKIKKKIKIAKTEQLKETQDSAIVYKGVAVSISKDKYKDFYYEKSNISVADAQAKAFEKCKVKINIRKEYRPRCQIYLKGQKTKVIIVKKEQKTKTKKKIKIAKTEQLKETQDSAIVYKGVAVVLYKGKHKDFYYEKSNKSVADAQAKAFEKCKTKLQIIVQNYYRYKCQIYLKGQKTKVIIVNKEQKTKTKKKIKIAKVKEATQEEFKPKKNVEDNEAPIIKIAEVITVNDTDYEFEGNVNDQATTVYVEVDGIPTTVENGKFLVKGYSPINKKISIEAIDQWGNRSETIIVKLIVDIKDTSIAEKLEPLNPSNVKSKPSDNKVALIIGIENYLESPNATYANLDAKYFFDYARKGFGVKQKNINLLVDEEATFVKTNKALTKWLRGKVISGQSELIIFFAGHGLASNDGKELYLLPQDGDPDLLARTALSRTQLFKEIIELNPKSVTIFLDTCYSGVSRDEKTLLASARPVRIIADEQSEIPDNFTIFSASKLDQISSGLKDANHGIFSYYLMKGLEGKADLNQDKDITNGELLAYMDQNISQKAAELGRQQNPSLAGDPDKILMSYR